MQRLDTPLDCNQNRVGRDVHKSGWPAQCAGAEPSRPVSRQTPAKAHCTEPQTRQHLHKDSKKRALNLYIQADTQMWKWHRKRRYGRNV